MAQWDKIHLCLGKCLVTSSCLRQWRCRDFAVVCWPVTVGLTRPSLIRALEATEILASRIQRRPWLGEWLPVSKLERRHSIFTMLPVYKTPSGLCIITTHTQAYRPSKPVKTKCLKKSTASSIPAGVDDFLAVAPNPANYSDVSSRISLHFPIFSTFATRLQSNVPTGLIHSAVHHSIAVLWNLKNG